MPPIFDGQRDLGSWIADMERFFVEKEYSEPIKATVALESMSQDVRDCIISLKTIWETLTQDTKHLTWETIQFMLTTISEQINEFQRRRIIRIAAITGGTVLGVALAPVIFLGAIGAIGFGAGGIAAGSAAAGIQAGIGNVAAGSAFAFCQSTAAGGAALGTFTAASAATIGGVGASAIGATEMRARLATQTPSYTWNLKGQSFIPSEETIDKLLSFYQIKVPIEIVE